MAYLEELTLNTTKFQIPDYKAGENVHISEDKTISVDLDGVAEQAKELYGTPLVASTVAGMTDHTKVYVYTGSESGYTNGHWYYWNGSAWADGGVYNSAAVNTDTTLSISGMPADAKATGDAVNDLKEDLNLLDDGYYPIEYTLMADYYITKVGGYYHYQGWTATDYISVDGIEKIYFDNAYSTPYCAWYDSEKTFISRQTVGVGNPVEISVPSGASYFAYSNETAKMFSAIYRAADFIDDFPSKEQVDTLQSAVDSITEIKYGKNRFNINGDIVSGHYLNNRGVLVESAEWYTSDYCYVAGFDSIYGSAIGQDGTTRYPTTLFFLCTYDNNKTFIEQIANQPSNPVVLNSDVAYVRFCFKALNTQLQLEGGNVMTSYSAYTEETVVKNSTNTIWQGKTWVVFGDSLTEVNSRTTKHYFDYVADETGISTYNMGDGGSGYMREQDLGTAFYQRIGNVPTDADVITIFGSFNDLGGGYTLGTATDTGTTTIGGCINQTLDNLFSAYPLAVVGVVTPTPWVGQNPTTEPNNASAYVDLIKQICNMRSIPCLDLFHESLLRPWDADFRTLAYSKDDGNGVHPDETGHKIIAPRFKGFLETLLM